MVLPEDLELAKKVFPSKHFEVKSIFGRYKNDQTVFVLLTKRPEDQRVTKRLNSLNKYARSRFVTRTNVRVGDFLTSTYIHLDMTFYLPNTDLFTAIAKYLSADLPSPEELAHALLTQSKRAQPFEHFV